jgi:hypothetical protein
VRDTTAWTVGRVLEFLHDPDMAPTQQPLITKDSLPFLVPVRDWAGQAVDRLGPASILSV